jgi:DNA repair protein RadC
MDYRYLRKLKIELVDGEFENAVKEQLRSPEQLHRLFEKLKDEHQETAIAVYMLGDLKPSVYSVLSVGNPAETAFNSRDVFGQAYVLKAEYVAVIHNHPKGDPRPSPSDREVMEDLSKKAWAAEIKFLDFVIVGAKGYWSMFEDADGGSYSLGAIF